MNYRVSTETIHSMYSGNTHLVRQGTDGRAERAGEAEVRQFQLAVPADEEVLGLQVAAG